VFLQTGQHWPGGVYWFKHDSGLQSTRLHSFSVKNIEKFIWFSQKRLTLNLLNLCKFALLWIWNSPLKVQGISNRSKYKNKATTSTETRPDFSTHVAKVCHHRFQRNKSYRIIKLYINKSNSYISLPAKSWWFETTDSDCKYWIIL
jgi:hypothetical protein